MGSTHFAALFARRGQPRSSRSRSCRVSGSALRWAFPLLLLCLASVTLPGCGRDPSKTVDALGTGNLRWASFPVELRADSSLHDGGAGEEDLLAAVSFWETRAGKTLFTVGSWPTGQAPYTGPATNPDELLANVIFFQNPWPDTGDWGPQIAGKTIIHSMGGTISHAVIFLDGETPLCAGLCNREGEGGETSRRRLIAHELGHFLGFSHVQDKANIMYPEIQSGGSLDNEAVDVDLLRRLTQ